MSLTGMRGSTYRAIAPQGHIFYGWWMVAAGGGVQVLGGALLQSATGAYVVLLGEEFGWSKALLSLAFSLARLESGLGPLNGWMTDRFGPRTTMRIGIVVFGTGFMLFSQIHSLPMYYLTYFMMAAGQSLGGFLSVTVALVRWFSRHRSKALSISQIGFSLGGLMAPLVVFALERYGWRPTAFVSGLIIIAIGLPLTQAIRLRPDEIGETIDGVTAEDAAAYALTANARRSNAVAVDGSEDFTVREALCTRAFWCISLGHGSALLVVSVVTVHLVAHLHEDLKYSLAAAGFVVMAMQAMQMVGQIAGGFLGDRFDKRAITIVCMAMHMVGLLLVAYANSFLMVAAFAVLHGLAWGIRGPLMQAIRADYFGAGNFGSIMGWSSTIVMAGTISGPLIAGLMADHFGNYQTGFTVIALAAFAGSVFFLLSTKPQPPSRARAALAAEAAS